MPILPIQLPKEITDKFQVVSNTLIRDVKENPKDRISVEIGDSKRPDFKPQFKFMRWDNEVNFSLRAQEHPQATVEIDGNVVKYKTPKYEVHQYEKPDAGEDGGMEFEWILKEKPVTNVLTATIQTKGLNFFYQPALTQQEIDEGGQRPENVIGSYAVYHKTKGGMNDVAGMEYKAGKAFHIYRPKCTDANGNETWGELNIDEQSGLLTVTINQTWLDSAVYPVVVDPTFGYTSLGASNSNNIASFTNDSSTMLGEAYNLSEAGTLDSIHIGLQAFANSQTIDIFAAIYREDSAGSGSHDLVVSVETLNLVIGTTAAFYTFIAASESLTIDDYVLAGLGNGEDVTGVVGDGVRMKQDTGSSHNIYFENTNGAGSYNTRKSENPWTEVAAASTNIRSIYATYTASGGGFLSTITFFSFLTLLANSFFKFLTVSKNLT